MYKIRSSVHDTLKNDCRYEKLVSRKFVGYEYTREVINTFHKKDKFMNEQS